MQHPEEPELPEILTVGHSTRTLDELIRLLKTYKVTCLVDVRTVPRSRTNPQFNRDTLPEAIGATGIKYTHMTGLGGLRHVRPGSTNDGWHNASFRGYADYMETPEFTENLDVLMSIATHERVAIMCAEAVPWRCHRSMIADALVARGCAVFHIMDTRHLDHHVLRSFAQVNDGRVTYQAPPELPGLV